MDVINHAQDVIGKGVSAVKDAVAGAAIENQPFMKGFIRLCSDGWLQGWHERNGGNLTYRMTEAEVESCKPFFNGEPGEWVNMGVQADNLRGAFFVTTGSGRYMRNVQLDAAYNVGIVEINEAGDSWRIVWGLKGGGRPTSEVGAHVAAHGVRKGVTGGKARVLYHAHPNALIALTSLVPADARTLTRLLWSSVTESVIAFPGGVGMLAWMVPGSSDLAQATARVMRDFEACVWQLHGVFASGEDFDGAFGLVNAIDKAADVYLRATALAYDLPLNEDFL